MPRKPGLLFGTVTTRERPGDSGPFLYVLGRFGLFFLAAGLNFPFGFAFPLGFPLEIGLPLGFGLPLRLRGALLSP